MNKNHHRLVFNAARGCIMAVAETVAGCCKGAGAAVAKSAAGAVQAAAALTVGLGVLPSALVQAQIVADPGAPAGQRPTVLTTPNGAPLVNIQTPSAAGVSRNTYQQFDVNAQGAVLNNSRQNTQTQLGGWVQGNPWLARGEARVILNEVNSTNPSQLKGFVEVAGQRAEVIIANPAGIHVDGAGFINASRATLTTGVPQFNNGSLEAFRVQRGTIRIDGAGLDAGHTDYTGILARAIEVNARVHAKDLTLITGDNTVAIDQSQVLASSTPDGGEAPVLALDVSQLGGMYAGKITFIGTEAGVGVRHHGTLSASAGDVSISSGGWLSSAGVIESQRGSVSAQTAQAQHLSGSVTAAGNISLNAGSTEQAQSIDNSARVRAGLEARIRASELNNSGGIDGQRLDVAVARLSNSGDIWQSGGQALQVQAQTLRNASGAAIGAVQVAAPAPVPSSAPPSAPESTTASASAPSPSPAPARASSPAPAPLPAGLISVGGELINQGPATLAAAGELQVNTTQALLNAGHIRAASVHAQGDTLAVSAGTLQTDALAVDTQAVNLSGGAVVVGRATLDTTTYTQAQGAQLYSQGDLAIRARDLSNAGEIQSGTRATVAVAQTLIHTGTMAAAGDLMVTAGSVNSSGALAAGLNADGSLQAFAENGAQLNITATGDLSAMGQNLASGALTLAGEAVNLSHSQTSAHTANITARGALNTDNAKIITSGDTGIKAQSMSNTAGTVYAGATVAVEVAQALASTGVIAAAGDLTVTAGRVNSSGTLAAGLNADGSLKAFAENGAQLRVNAFGDLSATGQNLASGNLALDGEAVGLNQSQTSAHTANIAARGALNTDNAKLITSGDTHIEAQSLSNTAGTLYAGGSMAVNVAQALASTGAIAAAGDLVVTAGSVSSSGTLAAGLNADGSLKAFAENGAQLRVNAFGDLSATGQNLASGALALNGEAVSLNQSQTSAHRADITARAGLDSRSAQVVTQQSLAVDAAGDVDNRQGRLVSLAGDIDITAQGVDNTQGLVVAATALSVNAGGAGITNTQGQLLAQDDLNLVTSGAVTNTEGLIQANAGVSVSATTLNNSQTTTDTQGIVGQDITLDVSTLDNTQGQVLAGRDLTVVAGTRINNTQGKLNAQRALTLQHSAPGTTTAQPATFQRVAGEPATRTLAITNTGGQIVANNRDTPAGSSVTVQATTLGLDGTLSSGGDMALDLVGDLITTSGQTVRAGGQLSVQLNGGTFDNAGQWQAGTYLSVRADHIRNQVSGELLSQGTTTLDTTQNASGTVLNRGLVDGADTIIRTHTLDNAGGRVFGDRVALAADTVINREGPVAGSLVPRGGTIAARERLDMGVQQLTNKEDALIFSAGDLAIGGTLDANRRATADGSANAQTINNNSATIESLGNMALAAGTLRNTNERLLVAEVPKGPARHIVEYQGHGVGSGTRYLQGTPGVSVGWETMPTSGSVLYILSTPEFSGYGGGTEYPWTAYEYTRSVTATSVVESAPAQLIAGGNLNIASQAVLNDASYILAGGALTIPQGSLSNTSVFGREVVTDTGTATNYWRHKKSGPDVTRSSTSPINQTTTTTIELRVSKEEQYITPTGTGTKIAGKALTGLIGVAGAGQLAVTSSALSGHWVVNSAAGAGQANTTVASVSGTRTFKGDVFNGPATIAAAGQASQSAASGLGTQVGPGPVLPGSSLFTIHPESNARFVVETDPRFTNYRQWLSSDYLLSALAIDPATTQKRLGDGFYEQKLVREQVAALTGYRFLGDHRSDEAQYMALMNAGATFAQAQQLRPGIALSPAQVAQLTSDIVWLVAQTVTLPDGRTTTALVPQVYLVPRAGDLGENGQLFGGGAVISGNQVRLAMSGDVNNSGTIMGRQLVDISARNITNSGLIQGDVALLDAQHDIDVTGGRVAAVTGMVVNAERNLNITSTTQSNVNHVGANRFTQSGVDRVAGLYVSGPTGVLLASAKGDINLTAAQVHNTGSGVTSLSAGGNLNLGTVLTEQSQNIVWSNGNSVRQSSSQEAGTQVIASGAVNINAQNNIAVRAAEVSAQGALNLNAGGDLLIEAAQSSNSLDESFRFTGKGFLSKQTTTVLRERDGTTAQASELGGQTVALTSGGDTRITGSNVLADQNLSVRAGGNLTIDAAQNTQSHSSFNETKKSGVFGSGGVGVTIGKQQQSTDQQSSATSAAASTVGSIGGSVNLSAGQTYTQRGSDVLAPGGDVSISAQTVNIEEARETSASSIEQKFKQSGLTAAITSPVLSAVQTATQQIEAAGNTRSSRMQAMAAANAAANVLQAADAIAAGQAKEGGNLADQLGGIGLSVSLGASKSHSEQRMQSDSARGSSVAAGGDVTIRASGAGSSSDLTVRGSTIQAGGTARLSAEDEVNLLAAANTQSESSRSRSSGASIGANVNLGAAGAKAGVTVSANAGKGQGSGSGTSYTNTRIEAQQVSLESGGDTTLKGAVVQGEQVSASVGGDLTLQSLQDSSRYRESSQQVGASATFGPAPGGSLSAGQTKIRSDYQSVGEQSAIRAGDGGFQVSVEGQSALIGAQITSSEQAVQQGRNRFSSEGGLSITDLQNTASYSAQSASVGVSAGASKPGASMSAGLSGAGVGSDSGNASSISTAGISGIAGDSAARTGDAQTGLKPIFDKDEVKAEVQAQVAITAEFGKQATVVGARYADEQAVALRRDGHEDEARRWDEGGEYRVAMHAGIGALTGGREGALGAGVGAALIPQVGEAIAELNMPEPVREALTMLAGAALGAAVGSTEGAAASFNQTANNYVTHSPYARVRRLVSQENARLTLACGNRCTAEDFRRIDQQVATLESAGNLAEIARHSGLSPAQGVQLAQLVTELLPGYGNAESLAQLVTGRSSLTGEEASRFWAAMGVLPLAGGVIKRVGEPSVEALTAIFRGGDATKPLATAADKALVPSAVQGQQLRGELAQWALPAVDHSRDAEYLAKTDKAVLSQNNFDMPHVLNGEVNAAGRATGYHAEFAADGAARIKPGATVTHNPNGTYEAPVQVFDAAKGEWVDKFAKSTFFPPSWSQARIEYEVSEAFRNRQMLGGQKWQGTSPSGVVIEGFVNPSRTTFYPTK